MNRRERNERENDRTLSDLRKLQLQVADKIRREYRRSSQYSRVNTVWVTLFQYLLDEVREREDALNRKYENVWRDTEDYLSRLDTFIRDLRNFALSPEICDEETRRRKRDIQKDLALLHDKINDRGDVLGIMSSNLKGLQKTREELLRIRRTPEFALLENWMSSTCGKCVEMENEITKIKLRISKKNQDLLESMGHGRNIFSKVNIEDLKKLPPFRLDPTPSTSSNMSLR